jgi:hypothetical protein
MAGGPGTMLRVMGGCGSLTTAPSRAAMPVCLALVAPLAGRLADCYGPRLLTAIGMAVVAATLIALALGRPGQWTLLTGLAVAGPGLGLFTPPNNAAIMAAAPKRQSGMAGGMLNMTGAQEPPSAWRSPRRRTNSATHRGRDSRSRSCSWPPWRPRPPGSPPAAGTDQPDPAQRVTTQAGNRPRGWPRPVAPSSARRPSPVHLPLP